ncbi:MAG: bifunctional [glutamine synthetase] adenylyltransferase/[glutamine synthetase]-adenylyl-L-tyrosine phosphorylase, partial [Streptosporangiaceae bacterium]|nr:bifunctional [glutamine synthetase] adenylyltransferase/[glutamine synthetase]-adenylyl-L-tyrosine phosphorylase [Streptosporangiaceae bacterium]
MINSRYTVASVSGSRTTLTGWLARMGFADAARAERQLSALSVDLAAMGEGPAGADAGLLSALAAAADPDLALSGLARIVEHSPARDAQALLAALRDEPGFRARLVAVLGVSVALADHLARHPADWAVLREPDGIRRPSAAEIRAELLRATGAGSRESSNGGRGHGGHEGGGGGDPTAALAAAYRRRILHLAARDLTGLGDVDETAEELADLAAAVLEAALAVARAELPAGSVPCRLAIIAMGKCGGRELNYASDVDVIFVAEPPAGTDEAGALATATRLAAGLIGVCARSTPEGSIFPVDPNLRPEGRSGPLVRTLASHLAYYERWAKTWEFQALLKARPVAGDLELGAAYAAAVAPLVWQAAQRENFVEDVQAMRRRVERSLPARQAGRELKLGPGGLRDIEFAVQLLQLVHGRTDDQIRARATLPALKALAAGGYVGRADADDLAAAYRFLRRTEHMLQLYQLRRTHTLPEDPAVLRRLGRGRALSSPPRPAEGTLPAAPLAGRGDPAQAFGELWRRHALQVRRLHEKLFYRPLLEAVARLPSDAARLTPAAARARLEALGYADPAGALRHIEALTGGVSRRAAIQRTLLPVLLGWFADAAEPDAGLLAFRQVSEALGESPWYLRLLRDETKAAERMAHVLASSRYAAGLLLRAPEAVAIFGADAELVPRGAVGLRSEAMSAARRHSGDAEQAVTAVRSLRRRELLRIAAADVLGLAGLAETGEALTGVTAASIEAALAAAVAKIEWELRRPLPTRFCVIAMGRFGGHETGYGSDADVLFVHDPVPGAAERDASDVAHAIAAELRRLLALPVPDPPLVIDADLRPEGRQGPLVRSIAAYRAYYARWSAPWEAQALLRAEPAAGDPALGAEFMAMTGEFRYPPGGIDTRAVREIRRIKARVEAERIPRGANPALHVKLGPGGLSDVEWTVQLLQLRHAHAVPELRTASTSGALAAALSAQVLSGEDAAGLTASWELAARIRNAVMLVRGRPGDTLPSRHRELTAVARLLGYQPGNAGQALEDDWRRIARRARAIMEPLFY